MSVLRKEGINVFNYIDDLFIISQTKEKGERDVQRVTNLLNKLGFFVNQEKSSLEPKHQMLFLGFILDSQEMIINPHQTK